MKKLTLSLVGLISLTLLFAQPSEELFKDLEWRNIGPANMGGRVTDIVGIPGDPTTYYVAGADGGIFKTINGGVTFDALFTDQRAYSVGALAIAPSDHNVLWLGSGEGDPRNSVGYGNGVYRSIDAGQSWEHLGLEKTERIKRIVVHPDDPDVVCICALGREWGPNEERGVFKTTDGGKNWKHVLSIDENTGCSDLAMDLSNPRIMYAGMWTFRRKPWRFDGGGGETAPYRSKDGGETWEKITKGIPDKAMSRIGIAVAQSQPSTVYMIMEQKDGGTFWRSDDRGNSWKQVNDDPGVNFRPFYYSDIRVDPNNASVIYSLSGALMKSTDGGKNFERIAQGVHGDHQSMWIDPVNSSRVLSGSDGGFQVSLDAGKSWNIINNVELSQFYQLDIDMQDPYFVYGGLQDNGCWRGPSNSLNVAGIMKRHWLRLSYGDGYYAVPIPGSEHEVYTNLQGGVPFHVNANTGVVRSIHPFPKITGSAGDAIEDHKYRFNWDAPLHVSPHDANTVYFGGNVVFRSRDRGHSWEVISPDLTTNDKEKQRTSGGEIYQDNTAAEFHCSILTIAESPVQEGVIWAGTDDGNLQITMDGGESWSNVKDNVSGLPDFAWVSKIHVSNHDAGTAFVAVDQHRLDDFTPHAYITTDFGQSWKEIVTGLPVDDYVKVIRQSPHDPDFLLIGMEHGIYASWDMGSNWTRINNNLPPASVRDLRIHPREHDIIVGTHGRGVWILDDARPLMQLGGTSDENVHLYPVRTATRWHNYQQVESLGQAVYRADNPDYGAYINFLLKNNPDEKVIVEIKDASGAVIRELSDTTCTSGINRIVWNFSGPEADPMDNPIGGGWWRGSPRQVMPPGTYTAVLQANGEEHTTEITVRADPRLELTPDDYSIQAKTTGELLGLLSAAHGMINQVDDLNSQLSAVKSRIDKEDDEDLEPLAEDAASVLKDLKGQKATLTRPPPAMSYRQKPQLREEILSVLRAVNNVPARPTDAQIERVSSLREEADVIRQAIEQIIVGPIARLNAQMEGMPAISVKRVIRP